MNRSSSWRVAAATATNIALYAVTGGHYLWLEGRMRHGTFRNWGHRYRYRPTRVVKPTSEAEIVELVRSSRRMRVFGSGHSFNEGVVSDDVLVSLDGYTGVVSCDLDRRRLTVRGGTRVRDVVRLLREEGWAFPALPSHDAQSIAGILATDVHGTGREHGFISESVVSLTLVDGLGQVQHCEPSDDLFRAAVGGVGAVGIITEVTVQAVPRFNVRQKTESMDLLRVRTQLEQLLQDNEHLSLYLYPFTDTCQVNTWNSTERGQSRLGRLREFGATSADALLAATLGSFLAHTKLLPHSRSWSRVTELLRRGTDLVLESDQAFNRSIYHLHQELEFTVDYSEVWDACERFLRLYEQMFPEGLPYTLVEVRFTPERHNRTLLGAGRDRRCAWIDLLSNDSDGFERYFQAAVELVRKLAARPHLGKYCEGITGADLENVHGANLHRFHELMAEHDPDGTFSNAFTRQLFGTAGLAAPSDHTERAKGDTPTADARRTQVAPG